MANYEELKKKAKDAIETIADVSVEAYRLAEEKARILAKKAKLNAEISREKTQIRRLKGSIGNKYYELHKDDPEEAFKEDCDSITDSIDRIEANKRELEELKKNGLNCECEADDDAESDEECAEECDEECEPAPEEDVGEDAEAETQAENTEE